MYLSSLVIKHKIKIFSPQHKYSNNANANNQENEIITFAGFTDIKKITQQINNLNFGNILINPYFIFRIRFNQNLMPKMQIKFCQESADFLDKNSIFNIVYIRNENNKNIFLNIFTIKHVK